MSLKSYYEKELTKLYEEAHLFSLDFPEQASALNLEKNKVTDPNVARMLEGCAFLSAKIHQMVDEESDHLPAQLIQQLWPQLAQGFPSVCIAQAIASTSLKEAFLLPGQTLLKSSAVGDEKTECQFLSTQPMPVYPLSLTAVDAQFSSGQSITFHFETLNKTTFDKLSLSSLHFFVDALFAKASAILHFLLSPETKISLYSDEQALESEGLEIHSQAFIPELQLNAQAEHGQAAQQLIFEAFAFPDKLQCLLLRGLEKIRFPAGSTRFKLVLSSEKVITAPFDVSFEDFKLFSIPCINRFEQDCEPISLDHKHHRYLLRADQGRPQSVQVLSVLSVEGTCELDHESLRYVPLSKVSFAENPHYSLSAQMINSDHCEYYLSLNSLNLKKQTLSIRASVSNAHYPRRYLRAQSLSLAAKLYSTQLEMRNISVPSAYLSQEFSKRAHFLLKQLRVHIEDISSIEQIQNILTLLNRSGNSQVLKRINALKGLNTEAKTLIKKGVFHQVQVLELDVDETGFVSFSDVFLFGKLLHAFFQTSASFSVCVKTILVCHPSEKKFEWLS